MDAVPSDNELRWLVGKIVHVAQVAESTEQYREFMSDVTPPAAIADLVDEDERSDPIRFFARVALTSASQLYGHGTSEEVRVHHAIAGAFARVLSLPAETGHSDADVDQVADDKSAPQPPPRSGTVPQEARQTVVVDRDVNAPIVNAPGGTVVINDRSDKLNTMLHDYLTFLIYLSFGIKRPHVTQSAQPVLDDAMSALLDYHRDTNYVIGRSNSRRWDPDVLARAPAVYERVNDACLKVFGLSFEKSRPGLFRAEFPSFDLFGRMVLVRGGSDPFTGTEVAPFYIGRFPVTVREYAWFCRSSSWPQVPEWETLEPPRELHDHPVTGVTLFDMVMYCVWLEAATGFRFRVATESEWCYAATAGTRRRYPWGDEYRRGLATTSLESYATRPVEACPDGVSPTGAMDMAGNVWELTSTLHDEDLSVRGMDFTFPPMMFALTREQWWETDRRIPRGAGPWSEAARFVMRGGSFGGGPEWATMDQRIWTSMFNRGAYGGFRLACSAEPVGAGFLPTPSYLSPRVADFLDRVQLTNADGSEAITQKDFSACGTGSTFESDVSSELFRWILSEYEIPGLDQEDFELLLPEKMRGAASSTAFPEMRPVDWEARRQAMQSEVDGSPPRPKANPPTSAGARRQVQPDRPTRAATGPKCSLCGMPGSETTPLVKGAEALICEQCVELCEEILQERDQEVATPADGLKVRFCAWCEQDIAIESLIAGPGVMICTQCVSSSRVLFDGSDSDSAGLSIVRS